MLAASHLAYRYGRRRWGLLDGHFSVSGPVVGVLGACGAGKSTLLSLLTAARVATGGTLLVSGLDLAERRQRRQLRARLGYVPQSLSISPGTPSASSSGTSAGCARCRPRSCPRRSPTACWPRT